jgi:hypothetical protein
VHLMVPTVMSRDISSVVRMRDSEAMESRNERVDKGIWGTRR